MKKTRGEGVMTVAVSKHTPLVRPSVPAPGASLVTATETRAVHIRAAVESVQHSFVDRESLPAAWADLLASRWREEPLAASETPALQVAWALVSIRVVGRSIGVLSANASLRDAETWFLGSIRPPSYLSDFVVERADREAIEQLEAVAYDDELQDLLPYVLDAHGPGSRASVMKDPGTQKSRRAKRVTGVFYTPSDVAEYITREAIGELGEEIGPLHVLDPACGSGVFLKAALDLATTHRPGLDRFNFVERSLYGIDINPLAVEAACFVLLHECLRLNKRRGGPSPWSLWHRIRCNLCVADALTFQVAPSDDCSEDLVSLRTALNADTYVLPSSDGLDSGTTTTLFSRGLALGCAFPSLAQGADAIIGNPPYAMIGSRDDAVTLEQRFAALSAGNVARSDYFPVFVEMMWRLARPSRSSSGMVVPLSLAYSGRAQMTATRHAIMGSGGRWRFAFFDREPHALFGEDVKTRNTIVFRFEGSDGPNAVTTIETGPLRKWTSRQRAQLFNTINFTPLVGISIGAGIPKLAGAESARVFGQLTRQPACLRDMCATVDSCLPEDAASQRHGNHVFIAGTAYNFLNVFRPHRRLPDQRAPWSASRLLALGFASENKAARAFAILGSRIAHWLWYVSEDGFHVTQSFVMTLPFSDRLFSETQKNDLARLGSQLWESVQAQQIISVNGGRQTVAYRPHASEGLRDEIDAVLFEALDVEQTWFDRLRAFTRTALFVDEDDETRRRFTSHFSNGGG